MNEWIEVIEPGQARQVRQVRDGGRHFDVWHEVPLVPQLSGMSCWAAAAAMIIGWRERIAVEGPEVAQGAGRWHAYASGLHPQDVTELARTWGLVPVNEQDHTVASLRMLLDHHGPLWMGEAVPGLHVVVLTGIYGDGTEDGTWVRINDPWPVGRGERYRLRFRELMRNFRRAGQLAGLHAQLLHTGGRTAGSSLRVEQSWNASFRVETGRVDTGGIEPGRIEPGRVSRTGPVAIPEQPGPAPDVIAPDAAAALSTAWADDPRSIDYRHLRAPGLSARFALTAAIIEKLCRLNRFDVSAADRVLFGLRGARILDGGDGAFHRSVQLTETIPDHRNRNCVLGVWNRGTGQIAVFEGSTVPGLSSVRSQQRSPRNWGIANLLPTGRYTYSVGTHRGSHVVPGAFRQNGPVVVLRTFNDAVYGIDDVWHLHHPADNIHPAFRSAGRPGFSSAGCNTVYGTYDDEHQGAWRLFRQCAGLSDTQTSASNRFAYVLLTGREARLAPRLRDGDIRLRFGSAGEDVEALQLGLERAGFLERAGTSWQLPDAHFATARNGSRDRTRYPADSAGQLRGHTAVAYVRWQQREEGGTADGVVTPATARRLGFDPVRRRSLP